MLIRLKLIKKMISLCFKQVSTTYILFVVSENENIKYNSYCLAFVQ